MVLIISEPHNEACAGRVEMSAPQEGAAGEPELCSMRCWGVGLAYFFPLL